LQRERITIQLMIGIYCRGRHLEVESLCASCQQLADYAMQRVDRCRFQKAKPTCAKCPIHCYNPAMREQVREVMRYAGPRMMLHHPLLAILHALDGWRTRNPQVIAASVKPAHLEQQRDSFGSVSAQEKCHLQIVSLVHRFRMPQKASNP